MNIQGSEMKALVGLDIARFQFDLVCIAHPEAEILSCALEPGDALVWNSRTFHSAPGNHLNRRRAALSLNFAGDDVTYFDIPQEPDPPVRGEGLINGDPITCETFPLLRAS